MKETVQRGVRVVLITAVVGVIVLWGLWQLRFDMKEPLWGFTWSEFQAKEALQLPDWQAAYRAALDELKPKKVRLIAYWEYVEPRQGEFDFKDLDLEVAEAASRGVGVTLVVGKRVPRWPECHTPPWVKGLGSADADRELFTYLRTLVGHYASNSAVQIWQVENEPFLTVFGDCPSPSRMTIMNELALVRSLDPVRPIMVTDSGELSLWRKTAGLSDTLGTTIYRTVWNQYLGWWEHVYPPAWYALRAALVKAFSSTKQVIVAELQAEPWPQGSAPLVDVPFAEQTSHFDVAEFDRNVDFARATGFLEAYLWGTEWWYWRKLHGDPGFWNAAQVLFAGEAVRGM